jgi:hypothetical protein
MKRSKFVFRKRTLNEPLKPVKSDPSENYDCGFCGLESDVLRPSVNDSVT